MPVGRRLNPDVGIHMKRKIMFGAVWALVGIAIFGFSIPLDGTQRFAYTSWLIATVKAGYLWFLAAGPASIVIARTRFTLASIATAALILLVYCVLLAHEMATLKQDHNLFPIEIVFVTGMLIPCLLPGLLCDGIRRIVNRKSQPAARPYGSPAAGSPSGLRFPHFLDSFQ